MPLPLPAALMIESGSVPAVANVIANAAHARTSVRRPCRAVAAGGDGRGALDRDLWLGAAGAVDEANGFTRSASQDEMVSVLPISVPFPE